MVRRAVGSNQYKTREAPDLPDRSPQDLVTQAADESPQWVQHPELWASLLELACDPACQLQWANGCYGPIEHQVGSQDLVRVLYQAAGDPQRPPNTDAGPPWTALMRARDGRYVAVQGYPFTGYSDTMSLVGESPLDLARQVEEIVSNANRREEHLLFAPDFIADLLADIPEIPSEVCRRWAAAEPFILRHAAAGSRQLDRQGWAALTISEDMDKLSYVQLRALENPAGADPQTLARLADRAAQKAHWVSLAAIARNTKCPSKVLATMLQSEHAQVRAAVMSNPSLPEEYRALHQVAH
jgi:hypothetical protein